MRSIDLSEKESIGIVRIIERFRNNENVQWLE